MAAELVAVVERGMVRVRGFGRWEMRGLKKGWWIGEGVNFRLERGDVCGEVKVLLLLLLLLGFEKVE